MTDMIEVIKENVSIYDLFKKVDPPVKYDTDAKECQINCPFHGGDIHKSARVYPQSNSMYCWACGRSWDVIDFWAEINEFVDEEGKLDIGQAIKDLIFRFNLRHQRPDWRKSLDETLKKLSRRSEGYSSVTMEQREELRRFYAWRFIREISKYDQEGREKSIMTVLEAWDTLDEIDLSSPAWKKDLSGWFQKYMRLAS